MGPHPPLSLAQEKAIRAKFKARSESQFPNLDFNTCPILADYNHRYNCIAYSIDHMTGHVWPPFDPVGAWPDGTHVGMLGERRPIFYSLYELCGFFQCYEPDNRPDPCPAAIDVAV